MKDNHPSLPLFRDVVDKQIFARDQATVSAELCCPADFPAFAGHFPGQPVLPAVMQLVIVRMLAGDLLQVVLDTVKIGRIKFKGMIKPEERVQIEINMDKSGQYWDAVFKLKKAGELVTSGNITFRTRQG